MSKDYKKLYEEALERARDLHDNHALGQPQTWITCEKIFPELRESEDERIKDFLHHTFTAQYLCNDKLGKWHGELVTNILAWLEKKGEQKSTDKVEPKFKVQSHWKPSEEQLRALINSAQGLYQCKEKEVLLDLYEQLKNL